MSLLITNPPCYTKCFHNLTGFRSHYIPPGAMVAPGINNEWGPINTILPPLGDYINNVFLGISNFSLAGAAFYLVIDIMIDREGGTNWETTPFISGLLGGFTPITLVAGGDGTTTWYQFPLFIPSGARLGARAKTSWGQPSANSGIITCYTYQQSNPSAQWVGEGIETLGVNISNSVGTSVTPGNQRNYSGWTSIGTSSRNYKFLQLGINGSDNGAIGQIYFWELGMNSNAISGIPRFWTMTHTSEYSVHTGFGLPIWTNISSGTTIQLRGSCSGNGEAYNFAVYGVY